MQTPPLVDGHFEESEWNAIADALPGIVFTLTPAGRLESVNARWYEQTGVPRDAMLDDAWAQVIHPSDIAAAVAHWRAALANGIAVEDEVRFRMRDGSYRYFRCCASPARDAAGRVSRWYGLATDIEDRQVAVALRTESERRLETFIATVPQIFWTADASGWLDWYSPRWFEFTGQTDEEARGWGWQSAHHPDDFPGVMEAWPRSIETGEPFEMEFRLRGADGAFRWFLTRVVPLRDERGSVIRWYGCNTDIEEQKRAQQRSTHIARTLQAAFLPERLPHRDNVRFDAAYFPAGSDALVGGDWYDAIDLPDGRIVISCGDVLGHGVNAAVSVGRLRQAILFAALERAEPSEILARVNRISRFGEATIATCAVAVLDPRDLTFAYALAGHPPPVVALARGAARLLPYADAPPLGVVDDFNARTHRAPLGADAVIAFYSDGVTDFERDIATAERRLLDAVGALVGNVRDPHPALAIKNAVMGDAASADDIALLIVQCSAAPVAEMPFDETFGPLVKKWRFHSSDARTARASRKELMSFLEPLAGDGADLYACELIVGEILANTVEHAPGLVEIAIDWTGDRPVLTSVDAGPGYAGRIIEIPPSPFTECGRGLFLIKALAGDVRLEKLPERGTRLRATLPLVKR